MKEQNAFALLTRVQEQPTHDNERTCLVAMLKFMMKHGTTIWPQPWQLTYETGLSGLQVSMYLANFRAEIMGETLPYDVLSMEEKFAILRGGR